MNIYEKKLKRSIDFILAFIGILIFSPILILISTILIFTNKGKPFFFQKRPGKNERIFSIIKFKTMNDRKDSFGNLLSDAKRLTSFGKFIRKTSLDEIPQLFNVLIGDMSLIGPRPLLIKYLPHYNEDEKIRHTIRPGITGLAQVSGRNLLKWDERLAKDVEYAKNITFIQDFKIIISTIKNVITIKNVVVDPNSLMVDLDEYRKKY